MFPSPTHLTPARSQQENFLPAFGGQMKMRGTTFLSLHHDEVWPLRDMPMQQLDEPFKVFPSQIL
jgi:hypothetical protein